MNKSWMIAAALLAVSAVGVSAKEHGSAAGKKQALTCPVMKAPISDPAKAPHVTVNGQPLHVCCPGCIENIKKEPSKYVKQAKDPVTGKPFTVTAKTPKMEHHGALFLFASADTHKTFHAHPGKYAKPGSGKHHPQGQHHPEGKHHPHGK